MAAVVLALLVLVPASLITVRPDPNYAHARDKFERELSMRVNDPNATAEAAITEAANTVTAEAVLDEAAIATAHNRLMQEARAIQGRINPARMSAARLAAWRAELERIASTAQDAMRAQGAAASRTAMAHAARRLLEAERRAIVAAARQAIQVALPALVAHGRQRISESTVESLREITQGLIELSAAEALKAGHAAATAETLRVIESGRLDIEVTGRNAAGALVAERARAASIALTQSFNALKTALDREDDAKTKQEKDKRWQDALAREQEEKQRREQDVHPELKRRQEMVDRFNKLRNTNFDGGTSAKVSEVNFEDDCAIACLAEGCDTFAVRKSVPRTCYRWKGRPASYGDEYFNGGRLR